MGIEEKFVDWGRKKETPLKWHFLFLFFCNDQNALAITLLPTTLSQTIPLHHHKRSSAQSFQEPIDTHPSKTSKQTSTSSDQPQQSPLMANQQISEDVEMNEDEMLQEQEKEKEKEKVEKRRIRQEYRKLITDTEGMSWALQRWNRCSCGLQQPKCLLPLYF